MIAEFTPNKRHGDAIRALAQLRRPDVHLALAGEGEQMEPVRHLVNQLGVAGQVHFLGYRNDVPALIRASLATVLVSGREGLPRSVMELLCLETTVIGTDIRGINDLVTPDCGWLISVGDVTALADAMTEAFGQRPEYVARGDVVEEHGRVHPRNTIGLHNALYAEALGRPTLAERSPPAASRQVLQGLAEPNSSFLA